MTELADRIDAEEARLRKRDITCAANHGDLLRLYRILREIAAKMAALKKRDVVS